MQTRRTTMALLYLLLWGLLMGICAYLIPYFSNDYRYMLIEGSTERVASLTDVLHSQYRHYFDWGGRSVAHVIAQSLLWLGRPWQASLNALCFMALVVLIHVHGTHSLKLTFRGVFFITLCLWLCTRVFGEVMFMPVSSSNYLYTAVLLLLFLLPYNQALFRALSCGAQPENHSAQSGQGRNKSSGLFGAALGLVGVLSGWSHESSAAAALAGVGLALLFIKRRHKLEAWQLWGLGGLCLGYALLMLSPGNLSRLRFMQEQHHFAVVTHLSKAAGVYALCQFYNLPLLLGAGWLGYLLRRQKSARAWERSENWASPGVGLWLIFIAQLSLLLMVFSPTFPARAGSFCTFLMIAAFLALYSPLKQAALRLCPAAVRQLFMAGAALYLALTWFNTLQGYYALHREDLSRQGEITAQLKLGERHLIVTPFTVRRSKYLFVGDVTACKRYWSNVVLQRYYGVKSIRRRCDYEEGALPYDFYPLAAYGTALCTADRGDPEDPRDPLNLKYLRTHPEEFIRLDFEHYEASAEELYRDLYGRALPDELKARLMPQPRRVPAQ